VNKIVINKRYLW